MNKLSKSLKKRWVAALRSGKYRQIKGYLYGREHDATRRGYCCMGVLALTMGLPKKEFEDKGFLSCMKDPKCHVLSNAVESELSGLNDVVEMPFDLIAQVIEDHPDI